MKIDCSKTVNFFKEKVRMTNNCRIYCRDCPMSSGNNKMSVDCTNLHNKYPEQAIEIVQKWSDEHPQKTRKDDLLEKYPNARLGDAGIPTFCLNNLGYKEKCGEKICRDCWNMPV